MNADTERKIREAVEEAFTEGMDAKTIADRVVGIVQQVNEQRTYAAARATWGKS